MHNAFDKTSLSLNAYFSTILTSKFGIKDKNHAPDKPTGPAPTINIDFFFILLILSTIIINFESKQNKIQKLYYRNIKNEKIPFKRKSNLTSLKIQIFSR